MDESFIFFLHMMSLLVSAVLLGIAYKWPRLARLLFSILFLWACYINTKTAWIDPEDYLDYAQFTKFRVYKNFINGYFANNIQIIVWSIAFCQLMMGLLLLLVDPYRRWGGWMAIIFLIAIAPLGVGSGFPTTIIMAWAVYLIIRKPENLVAWKANPIEKV